MTKCERCGKKISYHYQIEYIPTDGKGYWDCTRNEQAEMNFELCRKCFDELFDFLKEKNKEK